MKPNLTFAYTDTEVFNLIDAETSRHAAFLRYQDGGSAYDNVKIHTNDKPTIIGFVWDAFRSVATKMDGDCSYSRKQEVDEETEEEVLYHVLVFYLPDFDSERYVEVSDEIGRYVVLSSTARWLMNRSFGEYAKMLAVDSENALNRAISVLRTRIYPLDN